MAYAEEDAERIFQAAIIGAAFVIGSIVSILITGPAILDTLPSSYIIVTMLMGIIFIFFTLKDRNSASKGDYDIVAASFLFLAYIVLLSFARGSLSSEFLSYRLDALVLPLLLLSIIVAVADTKGIRRFVPVIAYLLFASPLILMPLLSYNGGLASLSANVVYAMLKALHINVIQNGLLITAPSGSYIEIASTCVPIGTFIAFIMLMIPVAYLFNGSLIKKFNWVVAGFLLLFTFNILRMMLVSLVWVYYGLGSAINYFHAVGGSFIFYISIVIMFLVYGKFGLKLNLGKNWIKRLRAAFSAYDLESNYSRIITAFGIGLIALFFSLSYLHSTYIPSSSFNSTANLTSSYVQLYTGVMQKINKTGINYTYLGSSNSSMLFELGPNATPDNAIYLIVTFFPTPGRGENILQYSASSSKSSYILNDGITVTSLEAYSYNSMFVVNYFALPIDTKATAVTANFEIFSKSELPNSYFCNPANGAGFQSYIESGLYNLLENGEAAHGSTLCYSEKIAS